MLYKYFTEKLTGLQGLSIEKVEENQNTIHIHCKLERKKHKCPCQEEMPELMPDPINFTDAAVAKVKELMDEEGNPSLKLRVFVQGGGCAGFQYGFTFDEVQNPDDAVMEKGGVTLLIDSMSYQYLVGAKIDFKDDLSGAQFVIDNPNAVTTCGCGSSFGV